MKQTHGLTSYLPDFFFTKCEVINFQMGARIGNCNRVLGVRPATEEELRTNPGPRYYMALSAKKGFLTETEEKTVDRHDRYIGESDYSQVTEWLKTHYVYWRTPCFYTVPK